MQQPRAKERSSIEACYLDLLERTLLDSIYGESRIESALRGLLQRMRHPYLTFRGSFNWPARAHSMIGAARMRHLRQLVETTITENIPGDYIEAGVWRGGACILMRGILKAHDIRDRRVFCADSFKGLPRPTCWQDRPSRLHAFSELAVPVDAVKRNFAAYGLLDDQVVFLEGLFKDTLPGLAGNRFALVRLDADLYESTMDALGSLYDSISDGGFVIIDDVLLGCRQAVHDFLDARKLQVEMHKVDEACVWWRKTAAA
jgi:O-methyltransferase